MRKTKKFIFTILVIVYLLGIVPRQVAFAQEASPDPSPTDQSSPSPDPSPNPSPDPSTSPSPSPDPCNPCATEPVGTVDQSNGGEVNNDISASSDTGNNAVGSPLPSPSPSPSPDLLTALEATDSAQPQSEQSIAPTSSEGPQQNNSQDSNNPQSGEIATGDAVTEVDVTSTVNTNSVNSNIIINVQNVYLDENGNIIISPDTDGISPVSIVANQTNSATVNNIITALANSGINTINASTGNITTGNAYAIINIINFINVNLINSTFQFILINIFGDVNGNIILPEFAQLAPATTSGNVTQTNSANVSNSVDGSSNTGENSGGNNIQTGDATTAANVQNVVNTNILGGTFYNLLINVLGNWNGNFLGWGNIDPAALTAFGQALIASGFTSNAGGIPTTIDANQTNEATVNNQITGSSNTGQNTLTGRGSIQTGNAFTSINLINFVNSNIIGSVGFFGIINIFGNLNGDIGGTSKFVTAQPPANEEQNSNQNENNAAEIRAEGGQLETKITTNVGTHVNPGDTVMFFITVKNPGDGPVYDSKVVFNLYQPNGDLSALQNFNLGRLNPGQIAYISFQINLTDQAPAGLYDALMEANGTVGPDNDGISSQSYTSFNVGLGRSVVDAFLPPVYAAEQQFPPVVDIVQKQSGLKYPEPWGNLFLVLFFLGSGRMLQLLYKKRNQEY